MCAGAEQSSQILCFVGGCRSGYMLHHGNAAHRCSHREFSRQYTSVSRRLGPGRLLAKSSYRAQSLSQRILKRGFLRPNVGHGRRVWPICPVATVRLQLDQRYAGGSHRRCRRCRDSGFHTVQSVRDCVPCEFLLVRRIRKHRLSERHVDNQPTILRRLVADFELV